MVVKEREASYGVGEQLATQTIRRNCPRIWLVCDLCFSVPPKLVGELEELNSVGQQGQNIGMQIKVQAGLANLWDRRRSMQSQESPSFVGTLKELCLLLSPCVRVFPALCAVP